MSPWIFFMIIIWLLILLFLRSEIKRLWSVAIWAFWVGYLLNNAFVQNNFYLFKESYYFLGGIPIGYLIGLAGTGLIMIHFLPEEKIWQLPYLLLFGFIFTGLEYFAQEQGFLSYQNWSLYYSFLFKVLSFICITWLSGLTVTRRTKSYYFR